MEKMTAGPLLSQINNPDDLKKLNKSDLQQVCNELRQFIIDSVSVNGGHFGASLGVVELSVALHYMYNTPDDQLVWDVGHQAYGHKILTGRREVFHTNRRYGGISGFPKRDESEYDAFGVGHSSTSISAALGMAIASKNLGETHRHHVAIIGDGAMTAGLPFEAMNHAGVSNANILVILNDNNMSIDPNVGALKEYLTDITTSPTYNKLREDVWKLLGKLPYPEFQREMAGKLGASLKGMVSRQSNLFEALGLRYFGPIDGHNVLKLVETIKDLKEIPGPKILHIKTVKGKGYDLAEKDQTLWHAPGLFDKVTGQINKKISNTPEAPKYQDVFGHTIVELAEANPLVMGITPAMPSGCSLKIMMEKMPDRAIDVGIAEQHAVTLSAGLATRGMKVFCNIYSSFMQRAYDMVIHDVAIQKLPVIFCLDRGGVVGDDGGTHHGAYDLAYMRCIPNMIVSAPMDEADLRHLMYTAQLPEQNLPFVIRYPRGQGVMPEWRVPMQKMQIGQGRKIQEGEEVAILTIGHVGNFAVNACRTLLTDDIRPAHYDMRFVKPLDEDLIASLTENHELLVTVEENTVMGGAGSAVLESLESKGLATQVLQLGLPDIFIDQGDPSQMLADCGLDKAGIIRSVRSRLPE